MNKDEKNLISKESYNRYVFLRDQHKFNDSQIAKLIGSDSSRFSDWKKSSLPNAILLVRIAAILNTSVEYLITGEEPTFHRRYPPYLRTFLNPVSTFVATN